MFEIETKVDLVFEEKEKDCGPDRGALVSNKEKIVAK
jgi:hypothetical protein